MKVLMFGWEFPPHISGGLGTACAGLTHALQKAEVDILFVVPKLHGGEQSDQTSFVDASTIPIHQQKATLADDPQLAAGHQPQAPGASSHSLPTTSSVSFRMGNQTRVEVPSLLSPYGPEEKPALALQHWNYSLESGADRTIPTTSHPAILQQHRRDVTTAGTKVPYPFSGTYGPQLLEEVEKYAQAGAEIAEKNTFDVIHAHDWMTYRAGIAAKRVSGKPLIVHVHATEIDRSGSQVNTRVFEIEKEGMNAADRVVTVSQWTKNIAVTHYGIDPCKIDVVHNGISQQSGAPASWQFPMSAPVVTFLGRITHQKGPMYFVEAARRVHERFPDVHFVVAGSGDQLPKMIERIAELRLSAHFHFTGFLKGDDINRIWSTSSVYVMPSVSEPFGIAPLEAIQAGVPVVLSKQAGVGEVMPHAIKVDFWNTLELAEAICSVLRYKSLANALRTNGAAQIKEITWDKAAKKLTTLYHDLISQNNTRPKSHPVFPGSSTKAPGDRKVLRYRKQQRSLQ